MHGSSFHARLAARFGSQFPRRCGRGAALVGALFLTAGVTASLGATLQAESAVLAGGTVAESTNGGFHGTGYANSSTSGGTTTFNNVNGEGGGAKVLAV